jgi:hypothetical protein
VISEIPKSRIGDAPVGEFVGLPSNGLSVAVPDAGEHPHARVKRAITNKCHWVFMLFSETRVVKPISDYGETSNHGQPSKGLPLILILCLDCQPLPKMKTCLPPDYPNTEALARQWLTLMGRGGILAPAYEKSQPHAVMEDENWRLTLFRLRPASEPVET